MATFSEAFDEGVHVAFCNALPSAISGGLLYAGLTASTVAGAAAGILVSGGAAVAYATFCNEELPPEGFPQPPFLGGQCNKLYTVNTTYTRKVGNAVQPPNVNSIPNLAGAIKGLRSGTSGNDIYIDIITGVTGNPGATAYSRLVTITNAVPNNITIVSSAITSVSTQNGTPDNCGNLPPLVPVIPPGSNTVNAPVSYTDRSNTTINNNYAITFGFGAVNIHGELTVPISVVNNNNSRGNFSGDINLQTGDININFGNPNYPIGGEDNGGDPNLPDPATPDPTLPLPPANPIPPGTDAKPERRNILRGAIVTTTAIGDDRTIVFQNDNPDVYAPDLGFIQFLVQIGGKLAWTHHIRIHNTRQIVECPWVTGAIEVRGTPRPQVAFNISPVYTTLSYPRSYPPES